MSCKPLLALAALSLAVTLAQAQTYQYRQSVPGLIPSSQPSIPDESELGEGFSLEQLVVTPSTVVLPSTEIGAPVSATAVVQNNNAESVTIAGISSTASQVSVSGDCIGATLGANSSCGFEALLSAGTPFSQSGAVLVISTNRGSKSVPLSNLVVTSGPSPIASLDPATSLSFSALEVGNSTEDVVTLTNTGNAELTLTGTPTVSSPNGAFSLVNSTCGVALAPGASCAVTVRFSPQDFNNADAMLQFVGNMPGGSTSLPISGSTLVARAELSASPSGNFGHLEVGESAVRNVTLRNSGNFAATGVYLTIPSASGLTVSNNTCGTSSAPVSLNANSTCGVTLTWQPMDDSSLSGLKVETNGTFAEQTELALSGVAGNFDATGNWSSESGETVMPDEGFRHFGEWARDDTSLYKDLYLRNEGSHSAMEVRFNFSGDTSQFQINGISAVNRNGNTKYCGSGYNCEADKPTSTSSYSHMRLRITYKPTEVGEHYLTIGAESLNGTVPPAAITLQGTSLFNAEGVWSESQQSVEPLTSNTLDFGPHPENPPYASTKNVFLNNIGTHGAMSAQFVVSGDTEHFSLSGISLASNNSTYVTGCYANPACTADNPARTSRTNIRFTLNYKPQALGEHSLTVTPVSDNGSVMPGAITFTGSAIFTAQGEWSTQRGSPVTPSGTFLEFPAAYPEFNSTSQDKTLFLLNTGSHGALAVNFQLSGDTSQFTVRPVQKTRNSGTNTSTCGSIGNCVADTKPGAGGATYINLSITVGYTPTETGSHSLTITPVSLNGAPMPGAITLTGESEFNAQGVWTSSGNSVVPLSTEFMDFGFQAPGTSSSSKTFYLRNIGDKGLMKAGFVMTGDTSQFYLQTVRRVQLSGSSGEGCGLNWGVSPCVATTARQNFEFLNMSYRPTEPGSHSVTITPIDVNGTVLPGPITFTGTSE